MIVTSRIPSRRDGAAALGVALAVVLATSSAAAAQGPPPPGTPPPGGPPPSDLPSPPTPPDTTHVAPPPAQTAPEHDEPRAGAALVTQTVHLRGRRIAVPLSCAGSGRITVRFRRTLVGSAGFRCDGGSAVANVRVRGRVARRLEQEPRRRLDVKVQAAGSKLTDHVTLRTGDVSGRRSLASASSHADPFRTAVAQCGNRYSDPEGFTVQSPSFISQTASWDRISYRVWRYWYGYGWELAEDWQGWYDAVPAGWGGAWYFPRYLIDYIDDSRGWYVKAGFEIRYERTGKQEFRWAPMAEVVGGFPVVDGLWCHVP